MNKTIKTYNDLRAERERLLNIQAVQKQRVKDDWENLKHEFAPVRNAVGFIGKMTSPDKHHPLMNMGLKVITDFFISSFVLGKAGWLTKLAVPFVVRNYSSHVFAEKGKNLINKLSGLFRRKKNEPEEYT